MADTIKLKVDVDGSESIQTLSQLETQLEAMKTEIKGVEVGSKAFKDLAKNIQKSETQVKNLNKSFEGLDTEAMTGEFGKLTGGITSAFVGIAAMSGEANESMEAMIQTVAKGMAIAQGFKGAAEALTAATRVWVVVQRVLNKVMAANPIGLVVAAVALLATGLGALFFIFRQGDEDVRQFNSTLDDTKFTTQQLADMYDLSKNRLEQLDLQYQKITGTLQDYEIEILNLQKVLEKQTEQLKEEQAKAIEEAIDNEQNWWDTLIVGLQLQIGIDDKLIAEAQSTSKIVTAIKEDGTAQQLLFDKEYDDAVRNINARRRKREEDKMKDDEKKLKTHYENILDLIDEHGEDKIEKEIEFNENWNEEFGVEEDDPEDDPAVLRAIEIADFQRQAALDGKRLTNEGLEELYNEDKISYKEYIEAKEAIQKNNLDYSIAVADAMAGLSFAMAQLFKEDTAAHKVFALASIIIDTVIGMIKAISQNPPPSPIGIISAAAIGVMGTAASLKVAGVQFAHGGILEGPSHAEGGILTPFGTLEGGEGVINKSSMSNPSLRNMASIANTAGGGSDFSTGDGSISLSPDTIAMITSGINNKKVYVSETDITDTQDRVAVIESEASIIK